MKLLRIHDPLYGFISVAEPELQQLLAHPYVQRLRRISQLGLTELVYPSATHTRFQHALGSMHLMREVLSGLPSETVPISDEEKTAALAAALLHDIGHSPLSHNLESLLLPYPHEEISFQLIKKIEEDLGLDLSLTTRMLRSSYQRPFFSELLSSALDVDRMDYLHRDSHFTGVSEGQINIKRLLEVLYVKDEQLCVLEKGLPTLEDFFHARRMMYTQVYHHKVVLSASCMLRALLTRAEALSKTNQLPTSANPLTKLLLKKSTADEQLHTFTQLQDPHLWVALQEWVASPDKILSQLAYGMLHRKLWDIRVSSRTFSHDFLLSLRKKVQNILHLPPEEAAYLVEKGCIQQDLQIRPYKKVQTHTQNASTTETKNKSTTVTEPTLQIQKLTKDLPHETLHYICYPKALI